MRTKIAVAVLLMASASAQATYSVRERELEPPPFSRALLFETQMSAYPPAEQDAQLQAAVAADARAKAEREDIVTNTVLFGVIVIGSIAMLLSGILRAGRFPPESEEHACRTSQNKCAMPAPRNKG